MIGQKPDGWDELVQKIERQLADLDPLGPRLDDGKLFGKAERMLIRDGRIVAAAEGKQINWRPYRNLVKELTDLLLAAVDGSNSAVQLGERYRVVKKSSHELVRAYYPKSGWCFEDPSWLKDMYNDCKKIDDLVLGARKRALDEGRIILLAKGEKLIPPVRVGMVRNSLRELFLFSRDLPLAGIKSAGQKNQDIKRAGKLFIHVVAHFRSEDRRVTKAQLFKIAGERFSLVEDAMERAYRSVKETLAPKPGKLRDVERVSNKEINDLIIMGEEK